MARILFAFTTSARWRKSPASQIRFSWLPVKREQGETALDYNQQLHMNRFAIGRLHIYPRIGLVGFLAALSIVAVSAAAQIAPPQPEPLARIPHAPAANPHAYSE